MKEQLELLWELQKIDLELKSIKEARDRYPKEMKRLDEKHRIENERIEKEKEKVDLLEKERRKKEVHLSTEQDKIKKTEGRMFDIKTNKEYQALLHEIESVKESNNREEEEILPEEPEPEPVAAHAAQKAAAQQSIDDFTRNIQRKKDREMAELQFVGGDSGTSGGKTVVKGAKVGRNDPCPCGSGKKYKKCCGA